MESRSWSSSEMAAVAGLVAAWDAMVADGEMDEAEMAETLVEQLDASTQGWDASMDDAESHPGLAALVGLDPEADPETDEELAAQDEAAEAWGRVVAEAARQWLAAHGPTPKQQHEAALAAADRAEAMAMELANWGWDPRLAELEDRALELARAAQELARELEEAGELG